MTEIQPPPPGWYPQDGSLRWWNGVDWTEHRAPAAPPAYSPQRPYVTPYKSTGAAYAFLLLLGGFAAHHFYLQRWNEAWISLVLWWGGWLLTGVGVGYVMLLAVVVWWIYDLFTLPAEVDRINRKHLGLSVASTA